MMVLGGIASSAAERNEDRLNDAIAAQHPAVENKKKNPAEESTPIQIPSGPLSNGQGGISIKIRR